MLKFFLTFILFFIIFICFTFLASLMFILCFGPLSFRCHGGHEYFFFFIFCVLLTATRVNHDKGLQGNKPEDQNKITVPDQHGASSRVRLLHCTSPGLTPAITANVGSSTVQFLVAGACVRAHPLL